ncbi:phospholipase D family protein [Bradyrhizobium sp. 2S1]|uniref:phospholipase D family protein n=1 Tax=Bradyrhizobium sp. 2S1 TaxID=1404429 RepID=UPI00140C9F3E|nr:phospholipase D family protein [Bradyrhizobium sp. 2S1]MCK7670065.1 phospholipase D family protein [Bradyrhizobium sp. 2S1]
MSGSGFEREAAYSVFEALRPMAGQVLDRLVFATYSLDLVAIAALILSLSKAGEQELEAGPLSFIEALKEISPRIDIVHQKDRLRPTDLHYKILHVLDRRLHAIQPPRGASYHPKLALARYVGRSETVHWRIWIGSRNLTGGTDREAGLLLVGSVGSGRRARVPNIAAMASELLAPVQWIGGLAAELASVRWSAPSGVRLRGLQWRHAGEYKPFNTHFPRPDRTFAISPFVDDDGCHLFHGSNDNRLLTTEPAARALSVHSNLAVSVARSPLAAPPMPVDPLSPDGEAPEPPEPPGLHAKLLLRQRGRRSRLWIGSANLTRRGMNGPNAEVLAELDVSNQLAEDLISFVHSHPPLGDGAVDPVEAARRAAERALDEAAVILLEARFTLSREEEGLHLTTEGSLDPFLAEHQLDVWLLTRPDAIACWPAGAQSVLLVPGGVPVKFETVLVCFSAARLAGDCAPRRWAQAVTFPGHDADARDRAATAAYIGLSGASAWVRAQLEGILPTEPTTWTGARRWVGSEHNRAAETLPLALEEVLAAWARNPDKFEARARELETTLKALREELRQGGEDGPDAEAVAQWQEVVHFWGVIREAIGAKHVA